MGPGGFPGLQNQCDLTTSGWVGSIPARSRHTILEPLVGMRTVSLSALCVVLAVSVVGAQVPADTVRADSARPAVTEAPSAVDAAPQVPTGPPISPRSAFLRSLIV